MGSAALRIWTWITTREEEAAASRKSLGKEAEKMNRVVLLGRLVKDPDVELVQAEKLSETERGADGFGSTGLNDVAED